MGNFPDHVLITLHRDKSYNSISSARDHEVVDE